MKKNEIQRKLASGEKFDKFVMGNEYHSGLFLFTQATVDSIDFRLNVLASDKSPDITVAFFKFRHGIVSALSTVHLTEWRNKFVQDFSIGDYFISIDANCKIGIVGTPLNFIPVKMLAMDCYHGDVMHASITAKKKPKDCSEALSYQLIDGDMPPGIRLSKDGLMLGIVEDLDCIDNSMSPSFNWYYGNHDGVVQSWGRKWRFKVRVSIASQPDVYTDEWFCVRVFNNWSVDKLSFTESQETVVYDYQNDIVIPTMPELCPVKEDKPFIPHITELPRYNRALDCIPCNDPNTPHLEEKFDLPRELKIRTPDELIRYYIDNQNNFEPLIMQLHNSTLFADLIKQLGREDPRIVYEVNISERITIKKFWLDNGSALNDIDAAMIANRTITGQINPVDIVGYSGEFMKGVLTW